MSSQRFILRAAALCAVMAAASALAGAEPSLEERVAALEKQIAALTAENTALRSGKVDKAPTPAVAIAGKETKLALGGFIHLQAEAGDAPDSRYSGIKDRFLVRRARLNVKGAFGKDFGFKLESDFGANSLGNSSGYRAQLTDMYFEWTAHPEAQIRVGQFKTPFGWEQLMSDTINPFVERSLASDRLTVSRQIGAMLSGTTAGKRVEYSAGIFNGNGVNNSNNDNDNFMFAARAAAVAWKGTIGGGDAQWSIGADAFTDRPTGSFTGRRTGVGIDSQFQTKRLTMRAEWLQNAQDPDTGSDVDSDGWSVVALWNLNESWQLATRYETYDPNTDVSGNETDTVTFGVNWFIIRSDVALSLDYMAGDARPGGDDDRLLARLQVVF